MTTRLLIARHGNTFASGDTVRRVGTTDLPLVASGLEQGLRLGHYLKKNNLVPDLIFTSKLTRAIQTAEQIKLSMEIDLPIQTLLMFNEIDYGPDENQPEEQVIARLGKEALKAWENDAIVPTGWKVNPQDIIDNWLNFSLGLRENYSNKTCLVVTSNGIARFAPYLTGDFPGFSREFNIKIATGAVCIFDNKNNSDRWDCSAWNVKPCEA